MKSDIYEKSAYLKSKKIGVLCGGYSAEKEVSVRSGKNVHGALNRLGYNAVMIDPSKTNIEESGIDVAFNVLHGKFGEDGTIQAWLDYLDIPCTGSGVQASLIGMNKLISKKLMMREGLPTAPFVVFSTNDPVSLPPFDFPVIIKPIDQGSSIGVEVVDYPKDFEQAVRKTVTQYGNCIVESFITGKEITIGLIETENGLTALPILELRPKNRFYDYEAKYTAGMTEFILPAELSSAATGYCQAIARQTHTLFGCKGMSRVDMIVEHGETPYILEVNTIPGLTDLSDLPAQARAAGIDFDRLIEYILFSALTR